VRVEELILASASPRRRALLEQLGVSFVVRPCSLPEPEAAPPGTTPAAWAMALAWFKARALAERYPDRWVLGADTLVACAGHLLGKPRHRADAEGMLVLQARYPSDVITGVCLVRLDSQPRRQLHCSVTRVWMRDDPALRRAYLDSGDWRGKAGAYGIQTVGDRLVERFEGSFTNVVGLPTELVSRMLERAGLRSRFVREE